jgi:cell division protein FtsL
VLRIVNGLLVLGLLVTAFVMYTLEHDTRRGERAAARLEAEIQHEREMIRLLEAEWSNLTRPQRLEKLAADHLKLQPINPLQYVSRQNLDARLPAEALETPAAKQDDPIAEMLKVLQ